MGFCGRWEVGKREGLLKRTVENMREREEARWLAGIAACIVGFYSWLMDVSINEEKILMMRQMRMVRG